MKKLSIGIDPGFDSVKITIENVLFKFPFNAIQTDESKFIKHAVNNNLYIYRNNEMRTWRVGEYARQYIYETKDKAEIMQEMKSFYSKDRFTKPEFKITLETAIVLALMKYQEANPEFSLEKLNEYEIVSIIALPHAIADEYRSIIIDALAGEHNFELKIGNNDYKRFKFNLEEKNIGTISQTLSALISITTNDEGYELEEHQNILKGPSLIIDGGYYTVGIVQINEGDILPDLTESNTNFAMQNVYERIEKALAGKRSDIRSYNIEYLLKKYDGVLKYKTPENKVEVLDLKELRKEKIKEVCEMFTQYLNDKFDNLLDVKYLVLTGGTGAEFYEYIKDYYTKNGTLEENNILLTEGVINNKPWSCEYAISVGAYKVGKVIASDN